jgi:hypothetical protein
MTDEPDKVLLKNGDIITGHIISTSDEAVTIDTEAAGTITIRRAAISTLISGHKEVVQPPVQVSANQSPPAQSTTAKPSDSSLQNGKLALKSWSFSLLGTPDKVVLGTQSQEQFGGKIELYFSEGSQRNTTDLVSGGSHSRTYKEKSTSIQTDVASTEIEQVHIPANGHWPIVYGVGDLFTNNSLGMAMQKSVGLGLLYLSDKDKNKKKSLSFDFAADARYMNEHLDHTSPALNLAAMRFRLEANTSGTKVFAVKGKAWVLPTFNNRHAFQTYASLEPTMSIRTWLKLGFEEEEHYLDNAPYPNRKNYFASTLALTISGGSTSTPKCK